MPIETKPPAIEILRPILPPVASMPIRPEPAKIVCEDLDDIPSVEVTQAASLEEELPRPITVPQLEHEAPRAQLVDEKPRPAVEPEVMATPEPVKKAERRKPVYQPAEDAIFASYSTTSRRPVNISYRSVLVSVGILAMAILILVGRVVMSGSFDDQGPLKTVQAETKTEQQPQLTAHPAPQNVVVPSKEPDPKNYDSSPFADEELDARQLKPLPSDDAARPQRQMFFPTPAAKLVSRDVSVATSEVTPRTQPPPPPAPVAKNNAKPLPFSPSVVIPYKGPQKSKTSNEKDCADQVSAPSQNKTSQTRAANITRPRIVRDPQN
jgi:hypothetical protein